MAYKVWKQHRDGWDITIEEVDFDHDLHAFYVYANGTLLGRIIADAVEDCEETRQALDQGESPIGWEDGFGHTIRLEDLTGPVRLDGREIDYEAAVARMDDPLREELHRELAPCTRQLFLDEYCRRHELRFGEAFTVS